MHQAAEPGADEPHIVIERQPAHEHVVRPCLQDPAHGADVGQQVGVGEDDALGVAGAARRVLDERRIAGPGPVAERRPGGVGGQFAGGRHMAQGGDQRGEQGREPLCPGVGDHHPGAAVAADLRLPPEMFLDLRRPRRRIDRHRDAARQQDAHEAREVVLAGGQHQHDRFGGRQPEVREPGRQPRRAVEQRGEADFHGLAVVVEKADVGAVAVMLRLPLKGVGQRFHVARHKAARTVGKFGPRCGSGPGRRRRGSETPDKIARGLRFGEQRLRERAIEPRFDPVQQLHPRQAVEPEIPLQ